jgi:hypothetical protein
MSVDTWPEVTGSSEADEHRQNLRDHIVNDLYGLLVLAKRNGFIVTVDTESLEPLAMRNVRMVGYVRAARK